MTLRFRCTEKTLPASMIKQLCDITDLPIGELRSRVTAGASILNIGAFEDDWDENRTRLAAIIHEIINGSLPLSVSGAEDDDEDEGSPLDVEGLINMLRHYREIELQDQRSEDLRMGVISDPSDFEPHDEDWTTVTQE